MKLTLKCLIDFRSWLGENYDMRMRESDDLPEPIQNTYIMMFLDVYDYLWSNTIIKHSNKLYNNNFQKELDENNEQNL